MKEYFFQPLAGTILDETAKERCALTDVETNQRVLPMQNEIGVRGHVRHAPAKNIKWYFQILNKILNGLFEKWSNLSIILNIFEQTLRNLRIERVLFPFLRHF